MNFLPIRSIWLSCACLALVFGGNVSYGQGTLYTEGPGTNPPFEDIRDNITFGYAGTDIDVNNAAVEGGLYRSFGIPSGLRLHTLANSTLPASSFGNWSRWYQEDGATQIFRLFPGEENVRNDRPLAARSEIFDPVNGWNVDDGQWFEWVGRYTILKPINAAIFQVKDVDDEAWSMQLSMEATGKISVQHRRPFTGQSKRVTLVENAIGQSFDVRIRDNGLDYEVYLNDQTQPITAGQYVRNADPGDDSNTTFRWGIYVGAKEVESEALIFVSHATVNPDIEFPIEPPFEPGTVIAGWDTWGSSGDNAPNVTDGNTTGTASSGGFVLDSDRRASTDGTWGTLDTPAADTTADDNGDTVRLISGASGYYDFTLTDTGGLERDLTTFHFDSGTFRPNSARNFELSVLSGDLTVGSVATGIVPSVVGGTQDWSDFDIDLTGLSDRTLDANGTVTFRLEFTGGTVGAGGHHQSLDNVAVTAEPPVLPKTLIAGWDIFNSVTAPASTATAPGVTATATASANGGNWGNTDSGSDPGRGSSKDMTWGSFDGNGTAANLATTAGPDNLALTNGKTEGELTFTITNGGSDDLELDSFHMDALAFRPNAARSYALNVLSGDMTIGNVFTSEAPVSDNSNNAITQLSGGLLTDDSDPLTHDQHDDIDIDLSGLADHTLASGESAVIQISFSNGTGSGGGHHLFLDNVAFSGSVAGTTVLLGDVNLDGTVNFLDISSFIAVLSGGSFQAQADCDQNGIVNFLDITSFIAILSGT